MIRASALYGAVVSVPISIVVLLGLCDISYCADSMDGVIEGADTSSDSSDSELEETSYEIPLVYPSRETTGAIVATGGGNAELPQPITFKTAFLTLLTVGGLVIVFPEIQQAGIALHETAHKIGAWIWEHSFGQLPQLGDRGDQVVARSERTLIQTGHYLGGTFLQGVRELLAGAAGVVTLHHALDALRVFLSLRR